jgi:hypothetical protein
VHVFVERHLQGDAWSLGGAMPTRVIDEDTTHHLRGQSKELRAILPRQVRLPNEPQVCLVHECGWLQRVVATLAPQIAGCLAPELPMHEREQRIAGLHIAARPRLQQTCDAVHHSLSARFKRDDTSERKSYSGFAARTADSHRRLARLNRVALFPPLAR